MYSQSTTDYVHELDRRDSDGVDVSLLWNELTSRVAVVVCDWRHGECFEILVNEGENALDVFKHPFAYAASRGIDYGTDLREEPVYA